MLTGNERVDSGELSCPSVTLLLDSLSAEGEEVGEEMPCPLLPSLLDSLSAEGVEVGEEVLGCGSTPAAPSVGVDSGKLTSPLFPPLTDPLWSDGVEVGNAALSFWFASLEEEEVALPLSPQPAPPSESVDSVEALSALSLSLLDPWARVESGIASLSLDVPSSFVSSVLDTVWSEGAETYEVPPPFASSPDPVSEGVDSV